MLKFLIAMKMDVKFKWFNIMNFKILIKYCVLSFAIILND